MHMPCPQGTLGAGMLRNAMDGGGGPHRDSAQSVENAQSVADSERAAKTRRPIAWVALALVFFFAGAANLPAQGLPAPAPLAEGNVRDDEELATEEAEPLPRPARRRPMPIPELAPSAPITERVSPDLLLREGGPEVGVTMDLPSVGRFPSASGAAPLTLDALGAGGAVSEAPAGAPWSGDFEDAEWAPFDWVRHVGFRHSSTSGRHVGRGLPLERSSWLNRPLHVDWFAGPLLTDNRLTTGFDQANDVLAGIRLGWDFDYFWGVEWRLGWADPEILAEGAVPVEGEFFVTDVGLIYYPWGDSRVRPYFLWGLGMTEIFSLSRGGDDETELIGRNETLLGMPLGVGVQFAQTRQIAWRLEILDNIAFGSNEVSTMHNFSFTLGMELRLGARPNTYWPWRTGRTVW